MSELGVDDLLTEMPQERTTLEQYPSLFTALGILLTFLGLIFGIVSIDPTASSQEIQGSIADLIGGLSVAFVSSIFGIILSLYTLLSAKNELAKLEKNFSRAQLQYSKFCETSQSRVYQEILRLPDHFEQIIVNLRDQTTNVRQLASDLPAQISSAMQPHFQDLNGIMEDMGARAYNAHAAMLDSLMQAFLSKFSDSLEGYFEELKVAIEESVSLHRVAEEKYHSLIDELGTATNLLTQTTSSQSTLVENQGRNLVQFGNMAAEVRNSLDGLSTQLQGQERSLSTVATELQSMVHRVGLVSNQQNQIVESQARIISDGVGALERESKTLTMLVQDMRRELSAAEGKTVADLAKSLASFDSALQDAVNHFGGTLLTMNVRTQELERVLDDLKEVLGTRKIAS
ncbi:MotA/TolQ/ExbB proton channel family protein [Microvenator marinus]|uniref:MotA/TolQ/ExbB proton channel family protein n=1 Tax=Microvenator marinus TaxID=2600177 RepID=A0A5B8XS11_9DELT|nr:MotA/TolQ/ExbB proton channel family protein [Microvenator marinus]QED28450.1 MotA/TolQ/ExbB proton channel family protein [Microvenator marinus]